MDSNIESAREANEFIATMTEGVLLFIITIPKTPYLLELSKAFFTEPVGMRRILNAYV
jgi:hypothetical protein